MAQYRSLTDALGTEPRGLETDAFAVPRADQRSEIGTGSYFGGIVYPRHASADPAQLHDGLLQRVRAAGATLVSRCAVQSIASRSRPGT